MVPTVVVPVADSKAQAMLSEIVSAAGQLERVTDRYAELGKQCAAFIALRLAQIEQPEARAKARASAVQELETDIRAAGLAPNVSLWLKLHALVSLVPSAADLPKSAAVALCPLVRVDAKSGVPAFTRGYERDMTGWTDEQGKHHPGLPETAVKQRMTGEAVADLVQTLRTSKANPEALARAEKASLVKKADAEMGKWAELTLSVALDTQFALAMADETIAARLMALGEKIADAMTAIEAGQAVAA